MWYLASQTNSLTRRHWNCIKDKFKNEDWRHGVDSCPRKLNALSNYYVYCTFRIIYPFQRGDIPEEREEGMIFQKFLSVPLLECQADEIYGMKSHLMWLHFFFHIWCVIICIRLVYKPLENSFDLFFWSYIITRRVIKALGKSIFV